jgi:serine/threonine protein kinase
LPFRARPGGVRWIDERALKGKVRYMSPEQAGAGEIDRRTDVFGAGMILWQLVAERRFWGELDAVDVLSKVMTGAYDPSLKPVVSDAPDELDHICKKALSYSVRERYSSAAEMRADVVSFLAAFKIEELREELAALSSHLSEETRAPREIEVDATDEAPAVVPPPPTSRSIETPRAPVSMLATVRASSIAPVSRTLTPLPLPTPVPTRAAKPTHAARRKTWLAVVLAGICVFAALSAFLLVFWARVASASASDIAATVPRTPRTVVSDLQPSAQETRSRTPPPPSKRKRARPQ